MKAQVIEISELFTMPEKTNDGEDLFDQHKRKLSIPLYQREFTWPKENVETLINDIFRRDKFIGILILEEKKDCYEIVDGQQRVTTCFLSLVGLYNYYNGSPMEQKSILRYLQPNKKYCLINASVGNFLKLHDEKIDLDILDNEDIYSQKKIFDQTMKTINQFINGLDDQETVKDFRVKLLKSKVLILINNNDPIVRSIEQVFLDINEKRHSLAPEEIFKGYCFKNTDKERHDDLRKKWVELKKCGYKFTEMGFGDLSEYLFVYILVTKTKEIKQTLYYKKNKKHILDGKSMDETFELINGMIDFGNSVSEFLNNIQNTSYQFDDLCPSSTAYKGTGDHNVLKNMCDCQLTSKRAQYQKIPLMFFIWKLKDIRDSKERITYDLFRRVISNLFVYGELFIASQKRKSNDSIDTTIWEAFQKEPFRMKAVVMASKELRIEKVNAFVMPGNLNKFDQLCGIYSIIDHYISSSNWIERIYLQTDNYTLEHLIAPNNSECKIEWKKIDDEKMAIVLDKNVVKQLKKLTINYLIMVEDLNRPMSNCDIVERIQTIREYFFNKGQFIPKHMDLILTHIENMPEYKKLDKLKRKSLVGNEEIRDTYNIFLKAYASEENQNELITKITEKFKSVFKNEKSLTD